MESQMNTDVVIGPLSLSVFICVHLWFQGAVFCAAAETDTGMKLTWADNILTIHGERLPGKTVQIWYLEAYCRPGSTDRDWQETVIGHRTRLVSASDDGRQLKLHCELTDGVTVEHTLTAGADEVDFRLTTHNPTNKPSQAHWAQPCIRVGDFTGCGQDKDPYAYLAKSFIFLDGKLQRLPTHDWAERARYTPGQVWCPAHVSRADVNPRPLSRLVPSNGLIGCFSGDEKLVLATAWEPYQELFQGIIRCLHSDFRIGGLAPGETKQIRGKIYIVPADIPALLKRYEKDFPEHKTR
jgi:hypothetical protein